MANKLFYGKGDCTIQGEEVRIVRINYRGDIKITKTCGENFIIQAGKNIILIHPIGTQGSLNNLFTYIGNTKILSAKTINRNGERLSVLVKPLLDYTGLLDGNVESMTINTEDLNATYQYKGKVARTTVVDNFIKNQHTSRHKGSLYLEDGSLYEGAFHTHVDNGRIMTGNEHSDLSVDLYILRVKDNKLVITGRK